MPNEIRDALVVEEDEVAQAIEWIRRAMHVGAQI
jgi:hypothetical protein